MALYHFFIVDVPSLALIHQIIWYYEDDHKNLNIAICLFWILDVVCSIIIFMDDDSSVSQSINADHVYVLAS